MVVHPAGPVSPREGGGEKRSAVDHGFALAAREVTVAEFRRFRGDYVHKRVTFRPNR